MREVYSRATKNCPWVGELWVRYLLCLERGRASEEELAAVCYNWCLSFGAIVFMGTHFNILKLKLKINKYHS